MMLLELFFGFLKVGFFSFGGAYAAIPVIRDTVLSYGWLDDEMLSYIIAVSESTPGPIMINMATYVGSTQAGLLGSFLATLAVTLPAFIIILLIMVALKHLLKNPVFRSALNAMKQGVLVVLGSATFSSYHVWCCQDYHQIGKNVAEMAAKDMKEKFGDDAAYILMGGTKASFQKWKTDGVRDGMQEFYPNGTCYEVVDSANPQDDVETLLTQHPEIKAVVSWHTNYTLAAMSALDTLNLNDPEKFAVYGSQMVNQSLIEIKDPESCYVSDTWMGDQGRQYANVVLNLLEGGTVNHWDKAPDIVVNADNADSYYEEYYQTYGDNYKY